MNDTPMLPFAKGWGTSEDAARSMEHPSEAMRERIYRFVAGRDGGATTDEIEDALGYSHQSASARVWELRGCDRKRSLPVRLRDSGERRRTRSGRTAAVWVVCP